VDSQTTSVKFLSVSLHPQLGAVGNGRRSVLYMLLSKVPEHVYDRCCLSNLSQVFWFVFSVLLGLGFLFFMIADLLLLCLKSLCSVTLGHF